MLYIFYRYLFPIAYSGLAIFILPFDLFIYDIFILTFGSDFKEYDF